MLDATLVNLYLQTRIGNIPSFEFLINMKTYGPIPTRVYLVLVNCCFYSEYSGAGEIPMRRFQKNEENEAGMANGWQKFYKFQATY